MGIHYENYKAFSKGQGFVGSMCRPPGGPMATSLRWMAVDCPACKRKLEGRHVINRTATTGIIESVDAGGVRVVIGVTGDSRRVSFAELDVDWAPFDLAEIFGMGGGS